jgi:hypothetical protein
MRSALFGLLIFVLLGASGLAQQPTSSPQATATPPVQDPQAVNVLNQALNFAGGTAAIVAIQDYTATGVVTYNSDQDLHGSVTIQGMGSNEFRMDATLPEGVRSFAVTQGVVVTKAEDGKVSSLAPQTFAPSSDAFPYETPIFASSIALPWRQLARVLGSSGFSISYQGIVKIDGHSVHEIRFQHINAGVGPSNDQAIQPASREVFIDTSTFQVVMTEDIVPKHSTHRLHYSDYRPMSGIMIPFSVIEELDGSQTWAVQLSEVT